MSNTTKQSKAPSHIAYIVREGQERSFWNRIGCGWENADGKGVNFQLEAFPVDGRFTIRIAEAKA